MAEQQNKTFLSMIFDAVAGPAPSSKPAGNTAKADANAYAARLKNALDHADPADLKVIRDNHLNISLDERLNHQNVGFFGTHAQGVMTRDAKGTGGTVTIWDNGVAPHHDLGLTTTAASYSRYILHTFAQHLKKGEVKPGERWIAYDSTIVDANNSINNIQDSGAKPEAKFDRDTLARNPWLRTPPKPPGT